VAGPASGDSAEQAFEALGHDKAKIGVTSRAWRQLLRGGRDAARVARSVIKYRKLWALEGRLMSAARARFPELVAPLLTKIRA